MTSFEHQLGPPALQIEGFQLWIQGRQFPESDEYWDGNWLNVTAHCACEGASIWVSGAILMASDIERFTLECERLHQEMHGEATLKSYEPNLHVLLSCDRLGHVRMRVSITPEHMLQRHELNFDIDQSYLPAIVAQCREVTQQFPVKGKP
jgi:hypothetical protein